MKSYWFLFLAALCLIGFLAPSATCQTLVLEYPSSNPVLAPDGNYYIGQAALSRIAQITPSGQVNTLHTLNPATDGGNSNFLLVGPDGKLYGTTTEGGANGWGTIFSVDLAGNFTTLYNFPTQQCPELGGFPPG
jgi:uncharacterized repeat protein (TIGR03803 family)